MVYIDIPSSFREVVRQMMARNPKERMQLNDALKLVEKSMEKVIIIIIIIITIS